MDPMLFIASLAGLAVLIIAVTHATLIVRQLFKDAAKQKIAGKPNKEGSVEQKPEGLSADFSALINAITKQAEANRDEEKREDDLKQMREWLTIALLVSTVVLLGWQVSEMVKVYGPVRDQADAAKKTADNSRAWVGPLNATFGAEPATGSPLNIIVIYSNSGHDPASGFVAGVSPFLISANDEAAASVKIQNYLSECKKLTAWAGGSVVYPTAGGTLGNAGFQYSIKTPPEFVTDGVVKGNETIIVQGCFGYRTSDIERHSYFCYFYKHDTTKIQNLNICSSGHYAD
jgi:hypothetical protein